MRRVSVLALALAGCALGQGSEVRATDPHLHLKCKPVFYKPRNQEPWQGNGNRKKPKPK